MSTDAVKDQKHVWGGQATASGGKRRLDWE